MAHDAHMTKALSKADRARLMDMLMAIERAGEAAT